MTDILMPALSPAMEKGALSEWYIKAGDVIVAGQVICEIETDKATMEVESIHDGVVEEILVAEGTENILVNTPIARMKAAEISQLTRETLRSQFHLSSLGIEDHYPEATHFPASRPCRSKVFVVHGHDELALEKLARFLEKLGIEAIILKERPNIGRTIIEKYEEYAGEVSFAIVLMTPDDLGKAVKGKAQKFRARQNVLFEMGYFIGRIGRGRVCLLRKGDVEIPSDLFGVVYTEMDSNGAWKTALIGELKAAKVVFDANKLWS